MSLLDDILNNKEKKQNTSSKNNLLGDILNNRINTEPQQPAMDYSQSVAARLGARSRVNATLGKTTPKMFDFSKAEAETKAFRAYQKSKTTNKDYLEAYSTYFRNPTKENKKALDKMKEERKKASDAYKIARSDAMNVLAEKNYEEANPIYKTAVKIAEPFVSPIVDLTSTFTTQKVKDEQGKDKYVDTTGFDAIHKAVTKDDGSILSKGYNIYNAVVSTATKMATAGFTGGAPLYYGDMFTDEYKEAINKGNNKANSAVHAAYTTTMGIVLDKLVGNAGKLIGFQNVGDANATEQMFQAGWSKLIDNPKLSSLLAGATAEGLSEGLEEYADNIGDFFILNQDEPRTLESFGSMLKDTIPDSLYAALVGSIVGGGTEAITNLKAEVKEAITSPETEQAIDNAIEGFENYKPDTIESAEAKERIITNLEDTRDIINNYKQELASVEQEKQQLTSEPTTQETTQETTQARTQEPQPQKQVATQTTKDAIDIATDELTLSRTEQRDLKNKLSKFEGMTKEQLTNKNTQDEIKNIISEYKTRSANYEDSDLKEVKNYIRNTKIKVSDNVKNQISDYNDFRKSNFGNLKLTNDGIPIDEFWSELKETYPQFASEEVNGETDILEKLSNYVSQDNTLTESFDIPDEDIDNITSKVFNSLIRNAESETETPTYEISNEYEEPIRTVSKKMNLTNKTTNNTIKDIRSIENTKNQTPVENLNSDDITITKKGISTNLSEKMVDDVLKITTPTEKPKTITISDKENTYKVKTPSAEVASKDMSEQVGMYYDNLSSDEKREIYRETKKKNTVFKKGQEYAKKTGDKDLTNAMKSVEEQAYYNQLDIKANLLNNIIDTYKDVNARAESFNKDYLRLSAGTLDGTNLEVSNEVVAKGQGLAIYYLDNHMPKEATDVLLKLGKLGTASGQASAQFNAMYQYTPYGIYTQTVKDMQQAYNEMASRKSPNWAKKNNPETNPNSRFRLTTEQTDYILKESSELHRLHSTDFKEYSIRKGKLQNYIADLIPHGFSEGLGNWVRSSLLLGTRTVFKNYGSNVIDTSYHAVNKINYSIYDLGLNKVFGTDIRVAGISLNGSKAGLKAGVQTSVQSLQDIIKGTNTTEFSNRYSDASTSRENITKDFFDTMPTRYQTKIKPLNAVGNWVSQLANNTMTWGDAKFAAASYEDNRVTLRKMNALEQFEKNSSKPIVYNYKTDKAGTTHIDYINTEGKYAYVTTNDTLDNFMKQNNMNLLENGDKIDKIALEYAQSRTYTSDTTFSKVTSSIINTIDKAAAKTPILKQTGIKPSNFIIPFSKIGSNLCYKMYRGSFLSIPSVVSSFQNFKAEVDDGNLSMQTQYDLVSRLGDLTTGTILYAVMGSLAKAAFDNVEGDEDDDEQSKVKKFMQSVFGKDKYSFKVGDFNFSFDVGGNLTNMLKLSLDLQQTNEKEEATFRDYTETTFKDILSEWTVSNLTDLFNEQYNSNALDNILQTIARIPSMAIPTFMKDFATNIDNFTERSIWDEDLGTYALNNIKAKIPPIGPLKDISRSTLPEKTDSWQNTMKAGSDLFTNIWNTYLVGGQIKKDKSDSVSDELMNIYLITQKTSVIPNVNKNSFTYDKVKYDLTDEEERKYLKTYATTAHNKLDKLFSSKTYQETDTETKLKYIEEIYTYANDEAKKEYLKGKGIEYYNYGKQVLILGKNDTFKQSQVLDAIDNNISYNAARSYQEDSQKFKFYQSFGSYEKYEAIDDNISDIKTTYSTKNGFTTNQRKNTVVNYVNSLNNLSAIQKAILIKQQYPSLYKSYDEKIKQYLKQQNLDEETYNALLSKMKIK